MSSNHTYKYIRVRKITAYINVLSTLPKQITDLNVGTELKAADF